MVTGDFKLTAQTIVVEYGIITNLSAMVQDISMLSRDVLKEPAIGRDIDDSDIEKMERTRQFSYPQRPRANHLE